MKSLFRFLVLLSIALYAVWFTIPYFSAQLYSPNTYDALSWSGFGAMFSFEVLTAISYGFLASFGVISVGLLYFKNWARQGFSVLIGLSIVAPIIYGISVVTELEAIIGQALTLVDGAILALMYFSSLSIEFQNSHNKRMQSGLAKGHTADAKR